MSSEKPFWEGKTLMEIQNLDKRVKVTMENGDVFIGKLVRRSRDTDGICSLSMQLDAHRTYLHVFSAESSDTHPTRMISRQNSSNHCSEFSVKTLNSA